MTQKTILKALAKVIDPELGINVVALGLIYEVEIIEAKVKIKMTLTTPHCPLANLIIESVKKEVEKLKGVKEVQVELVWEPPWTPARMKKIN